MPSRKAILHEIKMIEAQMEALRLKKWEWQDRLKEVKE